MPVITIIRTSDSAKKEIELSLSSSLNSLKDTISSSELGPVERDQQRLFHLGRELKSGRKSLSFLGLGKFENYQVHLHSTKPKTIDLSINGGKNNVGTIKSHLTGRSAKPNSSATVIDLVDDDDDSTTNEVDDEVQIVDNTITYSPNKRRRL